MYLLHSIGTESHSNYDTREKVAHSVGDLSFDGIYENVYENRDLLKGRRTILFVTGSLVGGYNDFDLARVPKREKYCDWNQIMELVYDGAEIGWHTWTHPDLTTLSPEELEREVKPPFPMEHFAYPYGKFNADVVAVVQKYFTYAWTVGNGNNSNYQLHRKHL